MTDRKQWCAALFAAIDAKDSRAFADFLTPTARFRYGSAPPIVGAGPIIKALDAFFAGLTALSHRVSDVWELPDHLICRGEVHYTHLDGSITTTPFCNVLTMRDGKIAHYDIYLDPTSRSAAR